MIRDPTEAFQVQYSFTLSTHHWDDLKVKMIGRTLAMVVKTSKDLLDVLVGKSLGALDGCHGHGGLTQTLAAVETKQ
jgi:hypothetical protein